MLKQNERDIRFKITPEIPSKKSLEDQYKRVCDLRKQEFTTVFWIIDLDTLIKESKEATKGKETPLKFFEKCIANLAKKDSDSEKNLSEVVVIVNNPCLEFWFLLHFEPTAKCFSNCAGAEQALKKHLPNYEKKEKFFKKANNDIYVQLKPYLKTAIKNSAALGSFDPTEPQKAICEMGLFFECEELKKYFHKDGL